MRHQSIFFVLICLTTRISFSQAYFPLVDTGSIWFGGTGYDGGGIPYGHIDQMYFEGDTSYNGFTYQKLTIRSQGFNTYWNGGGYTTTYTEISEAPDYVVFCLREDTLLEQVYLIQFPSDTIDILLYDFNLEIGDTLDFGSESEINIVHSIDTVLTGNGFRKRFHISSSYDLYNPYVEIIEGIGSTFGLLAELITPFESFSNLSCFTNNGETTNFYDHNVLINDTLFNCDFMEPTYFDNLQSQVPLLSYPNPANNILYIQSPNNIIINSQFSIYNCLGELMHTTVIASNDQPYQLNISEMPSGFYLVIINSENIIWQGTFIKQE